MSLFVFAALTVSGFLMGRWITRGGRDERDNAGDAASGDGEVSTRDSRADGSGAPPPAGGIPDSRRPPSVAPSVPPTPLELLAHFPCQLGDVLLRTGGEEAWLAGALVFTEEVPIAALFVAPDAGGDRAIFVKPRPAASIAWMMALEPAALNLGAEPPSALEHEGLWFERVRRIPVRVERIGAGAPDVGDYGILAEYAGSGSPRIVVIAGAGVVKAFRGVQLEDGLYEVLPSGASTL